jgi:hypothetical protein
VNEQQRAQELGALIDGRTTTGTHELPPEETAFAAQLLALRDGTRPDEIFAATLESRLKSTPDSPFAYQPDHTKRGVTMVSHNQTHWLRHLAAVAAVLALVIFTTLTVPPLRTLAQEVLNVLFQRTETNTVPFETPVVMDVRPTPIALVTEAAPAGELLAEAIAQAGFVVKQPAYVPEGYVLTHAGYDSVANHVSLFYARNGIGLVIVQIPADSAEPLDVGATAEITSVTVNGATGQYVEGGWKVNPEVSGDTMTLTEKVWDADFPFQQLRWHEGDMVYWMMSVAGQHSDLTLDEWTQIGESFQ